MVQPFEWAKLDVVMLKACQQLISAEYVTYSDPMSSETRMLHLSSVRGIVLGVLLSIMAQYRNTIAPYTLGGQINLKKVLNQRTSPIPHGMRNGWTLNKKKVIVNVHANKEIVCGKVRMVQFLYSPSSTSDTTK